MMTKKILELVFQDLKKNFVSTVESRVKNELGVDFK